MTIGLQKEEVLKINNWDKYYYNICKEVAKNSKCLSRRIGAILVRDKSIVSTGYNGPPRNVPHCNIRHLLDENLSKYEWEEGNSPLKRCPRQILGYKSGEGLDICIAGHAERNCLINAARGGIKTKGTTMYMTCSVPCKDCLIEIINAGIKEIVFTEWKYYDKESPFLLSRDLIKARTFDLGD